MATLIRGIFSSLDMLVSLIRNALLVDWKQKTLRLKDGIFAFSSAREDSYIVVGLAESF